MQGPQRKRFGEIDSNVLRQALRDPKVLDVFRRIRYQRLDPTILAEYYRLGKPPQSFRLPGVGVISGKALVNMMIDFLAERAGADPVETTIAYKSRFRFGNEPASYHPVELVELENRYERQMLYEKVGVLMLADVLEHAARLALVIADIGAGGNGLGKAMLEFADERGLRIQQVIGTDTVEQDQGWTDHRLTFRRQPDHTTIPIEESSVDLAILKWSLHHMPKPTQQEILLPVLSVLKPGATVAIIEALMGDDSQFVRDLARETGNAETWPDGPWKDERLSITEDYMSLSLNQQRQVLALEDWNGHWLESSRTWEPLPFTYLTVNEISSICGAAGFVEVTSERRILGFAPIIRYGPPTARLIFQKQSS